VCSGSAQRRPYHDIADFTRLGLQQLAYRIIVVKSGYLSPELTRLANPGLVARSDGAINQDIIHLPKNRFRKPTFPFVEDVVYTSRAITSARAPWKSAMLKIGTMTSCSSNLRRSFRGTEQA
jgi:hypothetical protein